MFPKAKEYLKKHQLHFRKVVIRDEAKFYLERGHVELWVFCGESRYDAKLQFSNTPTRKTE